MHWRSITAGVLLLPALFSHQAAANEKHPIVAVFDIEDNGVGLAKATLTRLTDYLSMNLATTGHYQVVPRSQLKMRLDEEKKESYKECYDQSCQISIGRELAAQKSLSTMIAKIGSRCTVTAVLYDLRRATGEGGATTEGGCSEDNILKSIQSVIAQLPRPSEVGSTGAGATGNIPTSPPHRSPAPPPATNTPQREAGAAPQALPVAKPRTPTLLVQPLAPEQEQLRLEIGDAKFRSDYLMSGLTVHGYHRASNTKWIWIAGLAVLWSGVGMLLTLPSSHNSNLGYSGGVISTLGLGLEALGTGLQFDARQDYIDVGQPRRATHWTRIVGYITYAGAAATVFPAVYFDGQKQYSTSNSLGISTAVLALVSSILFSISPYTVGN
jgi:hypothetical protein